MEFKEELKNYVSIVNSELEKNLKSKDCPEGILNESMEYSLMAGGKRIRPILILATYKLFKDNYSVCFPYAVSMEMIHNFSLIHDDLPGIDNDDFRHGKPTNHKKFNEATAILAGDALLNNGYMIISDALNKCTDEKMQALQLKAFHEFSYAVDRMIAGEYVDTEYEGKEISNQYLEYMHANKTGALLKASVRIGAILGEANNEEIDKLTKFAEKIGLTFQIKDDILSEIGDEKILGKPTGNDKERGKCTYVSKYGLDGAKEMLENLTNEAVNIMDEYGEKGEFFKQLALYIANREK